MLTIGTYTDCVNYEKIEGVSSIGGIIGQNGSSTNCKNYGEIIGTSYRAGGIIGASGR